MGNYSNKNAEVILKAVENCISELEQANDSGYKSMNYDRMQWKGFSSKKVFKISAVCEELSIFDWWNETLSLSQLKQMRTFLKQAVKLGFTGYVCFKVGATGCSHGMWAHKDESVDGYSPDGDCLHHSFRAGDNYFNMKLNDEWMEDMVPEWSERWQFTLAEVKSILNK